MGARRGWVVGWWTQVGRECASVSVQLPMIMTRGGDSSIIGQIARGPTPRAQTAAAGEAGLGAPACPPEGGPWKLGLGGGTEMQQALCSGPASPA